MPASLPPIDRSQLGPNEGMILVTGVCGRLGKRLVRVLHRTHSVVGVDRRPFPERPKDIVHEQLDMRRKKLKDVFRTYPIRAVIHLGVMHDPRASASEHHSWNVAGFQKLLEYVAHFRVPKLIVLSSANVYGPSPNNPQFLTEDAPLLGGANFSEIRDLIEVDMLAQGFFWKRPETETVVLRPVHILGSVRNAPSNFLRLGTVPTLLGYDPLIQVLHEADLVEAVRRSLDPGIRGVFNVAGPAAAPLSTIVRILGRRTLPLPFTPMKMFLNRLWRLRLSTFPAPELDHIRYVCMVDDTPFRSATGYTNTFGLDDTICAVDKH
ncbi:MAG: NAD-dependent epimerase/dehydratase family protein [Polyangiaceae bacterium]|nr:NAD-dependent epimerase/dehydratase family protein [Polyangiaceae bacterium]